MKIYIAGPMTGLPEFNFPAFHSAAKILREMGYEVVNPAEEVNPDPGMSWVECMIRDIPELLTCAGVVTLPGWERSKGAKLEVHIARELGLVISEMDQVPELV